MTTDWTECPLVEVVPGKVSGAPVLRHSRVRPQDIVANVAMGADWIADSHGLAVEDVRAVLAFHAAHADDLPLEHISPERVAALGADRIDWSGCPAVTEHAVIRGTPVRPIDLVAHQADGESEEDLAASYGLPVETVRSVLRYYQQHKRQLAAAV